MGSGGLRFLGVVLLLVTCGLVGLQSCSSPSYGQTTNEAPVRTAIEALRS